MFRTVQEFASPGAAFPGYPHPPFPTPVPSPDGDVPTIHSLEGSWRARYGPALPSSRETGSAAAPGHGFPPGIANTAPAPGGGGGGGRRPGGVGVPERNFWVTFCPGRGRAPSPAPPPMAIATTVQCMGRSREDPAPGRLSPAPPGNRREDRSRARLTPDIRPGTVPALVGAGERRGALWAGWDEGQIRSVRLESMQ